MCSFVHLFVHSLTISPSFHTSLYPYSFLPLSFLLSLPPSFPPPSLPFFRLSSINHSPNIPSFLPSIIHPSTCMALFLTTFRFILNDHFLSELFFRYSISYVPSWLSISFLAPHIL